MGEFNLTEFAASDLQAMLEYGYERFGINHALRYRDEMLDCFRLQSDNPRLGRQVDQKSQTRRHEHGRHVIYYDIDDSCILVLAIIDNRSIRQPPRQ